MYAMSFAQVGGNIQRALAAQNMTQQNLADALSVSKQVISKIIKGNKAINVNELTRIAEILVTTTDALLTLYNGAPDETNLNFMGSIKDEKTRKNVDIIRSAIDEIYLLEELANE